MRRRTIVTLAVASMLSVGPNLPALSAGVTLLEQLAQARGRVVATSGATLLAAALEGDIGATFDPRDRQAAEAAYQQAPGAPIGERLTWSNPDTGNYGTVTPTAETMDDGTRRACREYHMTVFANGQFSERAGIGCRNPNNSWTMY